MVYKGIRHGNRNDAGNRAGTLTLELEPDDDDQETPVPYDGQHRRTAPA